MFGVLMEEAVPIALAGIVIIWILAYLMGKSSRVADVWQRIKNWARTL